MASLGLTSICTVGRRSDARQLADVLQQVVPSRCSINSEQSMSWNRSKMVSGKKNQKEGRALTSTRWHCRGEKLYSKTCVLFDLTWAQVQLFYIAASTVSVWSQHELVISLSGDHSVGEASVTCSIKGLVGQSVRVLIAASGHLPEQDFHVGLVETLNYLVERLE